MHLLPYEELTTDSQWQLLLDLAGLNSDSAKPIIAVAHAGARAWKKTINTDSCLCSWYLMHPAAPRTGCGKALLPLQQHSWAILHGHPPLCVSTPDLSALPKCLPVYRIHGSRAHSWNDPATNPLPATAPVRYRFFLGTRWTLPHRSHRRSSTHVTK